jgi:hypothetical protein
MSRVLGGLAAMVVATAVVLAPAEPARADCVRTVTIGSHGQVEGDPEVGAVGLITLQPFTFAVTSAGCAAAGSISYQTVDLTATAGSDYHPGEGTLWFGAGDLGDHTITVQVIRDLTVEPDDLFQVHICDTTGAVTTGSHGDGLIVNDDSAPGRTAAAPPAAPVGVAGYGCGR